MGILLGIPSKTRHLPLPTDPYKVLIIMWILELAEGLEPPTL